jgi:tRNA U34 2-thiouridine synthase MnmA/TrmU
MCRYRGAPIAATARLLSGERMVVRLAEPVSIVTPGQLLVLYDAANAEVLASGIIEQ